ncbi:CLUMA_CG006852, isoform A [Clunio marinus]|uniref:CLUMA_CG006852, isoform A n=1 Tax=Clunio marinus TaxID=568069 RepID=A0A1J1HZ55_9DIPT|nr:CLUMA_CG006852, isoform A [Clunio marinus]
MKQAKSYDESSQSDKLQFKLNYISVLFGYSITQAHVQKANFVCNEASLKDGKTKITFCEKYASNFINTSKTEDRRDSTKILIKKHTTANSSFYMHKQ